jgi:methyl-accepting chemotaxis protein
MRAREKALMRFTLRKKFFVFILLFLSVLGVLIYVLNAPYKEMKVLMAAIRNDIAQITAAEKYLRNVVHQQHRLALIVLNRDQPSDRRDFDEYSRNVEVAFREWEAAFQLSEPSRRKREEVVGLLYEIKEASKQIQALSEQVLSLSSEGKAHTVVDVMEMIDIQLDQVLAQHVDTIIKELETTVKEELPLLFSNLQRIAIVPLAKTDIQLYEISLELEHTIQIHRISRFFAGQYREVLGIFVGNRPEVNKDQQYSDFRKKMQTILDEWRKGAPASEAEEDKREDEAEMEAMKNMVPLLERLERISSGALSLAGKDRPDTQAMIRELDEIDRKLDPQFETMVANEEYEINKRIDSAVGIVDSARSAVVAISVILAMVGILTLWFLFRNMVMPVIQLRDASIKIGRGDFAAEVQAQSRDEVGELAKAFEGMRKNLNATMNELRDEISVRKKAEDEREKVIGELKKAIAEIKTLSGLLPICSYCKKIRDDSGYWTQVESYISDHSGAVFTHGYCPECEAKVREEIKQYKKKV